MPDAHCGPRVPSSLTIVRAPCFPRPNFSRPADGGPTTEPMLHQEANPGVLYEFYAPSGANDVRPLSFDRLAGAFLRTLQLQLRRRPAESAGGVCRTIDYEPVEDELCDALVKPQASRQCSVDPCPAFWKVGEWEACSASCGGGTQYRSVVCVQVVGDYTTVVPDAQCKAGHSELEVARNCDQFKCPIGRSAGGHRVIHAVSAAGRVAPCAPPRTAPSTRCPCARRRRNRNCPMPAIMRRPAMPCGFSRNGANVRSAICGEGVQTREVFCGTVDNRNASQVVRVATDLCEAGRKLEGKQNCKENFTCDGRWFSGPLMPCTQKCGDGSKRRYIICLKNDSVLDSSSCDKEEKSTDSEDSNTDPCDKGQRTSKNDDVVFPEIFVYRAYRFLNDMT
ncbi:ADAMTS-like protein 4 isoform X2 [Paramacrobiotus metropolitanus]|uniref:ADAMTS-like protein 4 isoform X2 n=1 Tax=Paramacrobiotus metropolitanus TaxID=2943436 RepID=UPI0024464098|nr:ADAMTS-like protein 4 isoform X2 [Paramacrobiotus metropolitanus]